MFLARLSLQIRHGCTQDDITMFELDEVKLNNESHPSSDKRITQNNENMFKYRHFIHKMLANKEVLVVLDNVEDPLEDDNDHFVAELESLIDSCFKLRLLVTSRRTINKLSHNNEKPYTL